MKREDTITDNEIVSPIGREFPTQPNSMKIITLAEAIGIINHTKFCNDQLNEYQITEGHILPMEWLIAYNIVA